jgi:hypothetical protein
MKMVTTSMNLLVNQDIDTMSLRSQKSRVTFSEEIEMDSLEPELNNLIGKGGVLGTIKEYEFNGQTIEDEFDDENLNDFHEFDVSYCYMIKMMDVKEKCVRRRLKQMTVSLYALKVQKNCLAKCSYDFVC